MTEYTPEQLRVLAEEQGIPVGRIGRSEALAHTQALRKVTADLIGDMSEAVRKLAEANERLDRAEAALREALK